MFRCEVSLSGSLPPGSASQLVVVPAGAEDRPVVSYTPEQRRMFRNGLRIWARVAIRSYMRKHGTALSLPEAAPDGGEEESQ